VEFLKKFGQYNYLNQNENIVMAEWDKPVVNGQNYDVNPCGALTNLLLRLDTRMPTPVNFKTCY